MYLTSNVLADGIAIILLNFISYHSFYLIYPDVMGNYVLRLCVGFNLLCIGR